LLYARCKPSVSKPGLAAGQSQTAVLPRYRLEAGFLLPPRRLLSREP